MFTRRYQSIKPIHWLVALILAAAPISLGAAGYATEIEADEDWCCEHTGCEGGPDNCDSTQGHHCYKNGIQPC